MTTTNTKAGQINREWIEAARLNECEGSTIADWFAQVLNCGVEIDDEGSVWVPSQNRWLTQAEIDGVCQRIDG